MNDLVKQTPERTRLKANVLILAAIGAVMVGALAIIFGESQANLVIGIAGTLIGGFAGVMRDLIAPEPDPSVPASVVAEMLSVLAGKTTGPA